MFASVHPEKCPCSLSMEDFEQHDPCSTDPSNENNSASTLLITGKVLTSDNKIRLIKAHFKLLALKFHPDRNPLSDVDLCTRQMQAINNAYYKLLHEAEFESENPSVIVQNGRVYTLLDPNNISCTFTDSFCIYSQPGLTNSWKEVLENKIGSSPTVLKPNKGVQFGKPGQSLYVTVYNNGTIHCQGAMGLTFGTSVLSTTIMEYIIDKTKSLSIKCNKANWSHKFREYIQLFDKSMIAITNGKACPDDITKGSNNNDGMSSTHIVQIANQLVEQDTNDNIVNNNLSSERTVQNSPTKQNTQTEFPHTCNSCPELISQVSLLTNQLKSALEQIKNLESTVKSIKMSQGQVESTLGPQLAGALTRIQNLEAAHSKPAWSKVASASLVEQTNSSVNNQTKLPETNTQDANKSKTQISQNATLTNTREPIKFEAEKCLVIYDIHTPARGDDEIRRLIGKSSKTAIVERIIRTGERAPRYIVQFYKQDMIEKVIQNWDSSNLGSSKVRLPIKSNPENRPNKLGFAKKVPLDISEDEIKTAISDNFPGATGARLKKGNKWLKTVKISFKDDGQLTRAVTGGLLFDSLSLCVLVEKGNSSIVYTQCFKCWRYGHITAHCRSQVTCKKCTGEHDHKDCTSPEQKCRNCHLDHAADQWSSCDSFTVYKNKIMSRHQNSNA